jgi:hypothetical protein
MSSIRKNTTSMVNKIIILAERDAIGGTLEVNSSMWSQVKKQHSMMRRGNTLREPDSAFLGICKANVIQGTIAVQQG